MGHLDVVEEEDDGVDEDEGGGEVGAQLGDPAEVDGAERVADEGGGRDAVAAHRRLDGAHRRAGRRRAAGRYALRDEGELEHYGGRVSGHLRRRCGEVYGDLGGI